MNGNDFLVAREKIEGLIYNVRDKQVMLDSDLARLYGCKNGTKTINQAVGRHKDRFPKDFYFQLSEQEYNFLMFQFESSKNDLRSQLGTASQYKRFLPYVFTEQGVAMLATILKTEVAAQVSVSIMRAFVMMRKYMSSDLVAQKHINDLVLEDHNKIKILEASFRKFEEKRESTEIYFDGQIYDAYSKILDIFLEATKSLIIIDAYADKNLLDIVRNLNIKVVLVVKNDSLISKQDLEKYNKQYHNLKVIYNNTFHDRYFILDNKKVYHCGASINRIGYKTFSITKIGDTSVCRMLLDRITEIMV